MTTARQQAKTMLAAGKPLENALFLFSPPPGMTSEVARKRALIVLGVSVALEAISFAVLGYLTRNPKLQIGSALFPILLLVVGSAFLLLPASLYRLIFGASPPDNGFTKFLRGVFAFGLFLVMFIASLVVYGQVTG